MVEALERIAEALAPQDPPPVTQPGHCPACDAPEEKQVDASTLTEPNRKKCLVCQVEYDG